MIPSEESITLMTSYRLPHHGNRFFAVALNDALPAFLATAADPSHSFRMTLNISLIMTPFPQIVIQNGRKNTV